MVNRFVFALCIGSLSIGCDDPRLPRLDGGGTDSAIEASTDAARDGSAPSDSAMIVDSAGDASDSGDASGSPADSASDARDDSAVDAAMDSAQDGANSDAGDDGNG